jgi:antitoxin (DNA-binding transcriptional repressor) of toxin-antitoxin stability system
MCYMLSPKQVGVRELRQNLSVHLARVIRGETLEVTDRGHAVAVLAPLAQGASVLDRLRLTGYLIPAAGDVLTLKRPRRAASKRGTRALQRQRADRL